MSNNKLTEAVDGVEINSTKEYPPCLERTYRVTVSRDRGVSLEIRAKDFLGSYFLNGILTQTGGRWVIFDPENPADKILDREILPEVKRLCRAIIAIDKGWREHQVEYTDTRGRTWRLPEPGVK